VCKGGTSAYHESSAARPRSLLPSAPPGWLASHLAVDARAVPAARRIRRRGCPAQSADEASAPSRASLNITFEHVLQHTCGKLARCHWPWLRLVRPRTSACPGEARTLCVWHGCMASRGSPGYCGPRCMPGPAHLGERALCCTALIEHDGRSARAALNLQAVARQVGDGLSHDDAERRDALLPLALAAMEAGLRRMPDALGCAEMRASGRVAFHVRPLRHLVPDIPWLRGDLRALATALPVACKHGGSAGVAGAPVTSPDPKLSAPACRRWGTRSRCCCAWALARSPRRLPGRCSRRWPSCSRWRMRQAPPCAQSYGCAASASGGRGGPLQRAACMQTNPVCVNWYCLTRRSLKRCKATMLVRAYGTC
jgi:hypothetical protein